MANHEKQNQTSVYQLKEIPGECTIAQLYQTLPGVKKAIMECHDENDHLFSFVCASPYQELIGSQSASTYMDHISGERETKMCHPLEMLQTIFPKKEWKLPFPFAGGALGYIGYDNGRYMLHMHENLPDELQMPDVHLLFYRDIVIFDHEQGSIFLLAIQTADENNQELAQRIQNMQGAVTAAADQNDKRPAITADFTPEMTKLAFISMVKKAKQEMNQQKIAQVVLSQRMKADFPGDPFHFYNQLRTANPSPYMFYIDFQAYTILGTSPESVVKTVGKQVYTNPIAGTYPRGENAANDKQLEQKLLADPKERLEHEMLIARCKQDLETVCHADTIQIPAYMYIKYYEHVMHIVSDVTATLKENHSSLDVLLACLPAGTVSGEPKAEAMTLISELENQKRGVYGGGVGYINFCYDLNFALAIRMMIVKEKTAYVQAGAGIISESVPEKEYEETMNKAKSIMYAGTGKNTSKPYHSKERMKIMKGHLEKLIANQDLSRDEMHDAITSIFENEVSDSQIAAFMIALGKKGETPDEIAGMAEVIRQHSSQAGTEPVNMMDNCGTGGDKSLSFNISTAAAFVLAGAGVKVAKHGNRSISSKTGSADVLEALGVPLDLEKAQTEEIIAENNIAFLYAPHVHQKLGQITKVRKELGIPTIFNLLGPLTNPMQLTTQFMGIYRRDMLETMARALQKLGRKRAIVINGAGHMDEASLAGVNHLCSLENNQIQTFTLHPHEAGLPVYQNKDIRGGATKENAQILKDVLNGKPGACLDTVLFNAGIALVACGKAKTVKEGVQLAKESIASGAAMAKLQFLINCKPRYKSIS